MTSCLDLLIEFSERFPKAGLAIRETPLQRLPAISARVGRDVLVKRDDWGDFALAGSKARKLDLILAKVKADGYSCVVGSGPPSSNSCRALAAACAQLSLECHLFLWGDKPAIVRGNPALSTALGASLHWVGDLSWEEKEEIAVKFANQNRAYILSPGGTEPLGIAGMMLAYFELVTQCEQMGVNPKQIVHASATGGISAGLRLGAAAYAKVNPAFAPRVISVATLNDIYGGRIAERYESITDNAMKSLGLDAVSPLCIDFDFVGSGYGTVTTEAKEASAIFALHEAIFTDGYYVGKAAAALLSKYSQLEGPSILWHSGGTQGLLDERMMTTLWESDSTTEAADI